MKNDLTSKFLIALPFPPAPLCREVLANSMADESLRRAAGFGLATQDSEAEYEQIRALSQSIHTTRHPTFTAWALWMCCHQARQRRLHRTSVDLAIHLIDHLHSTLPASLSEAVAAIICEIGLDHHRHDLISAGLTACSQAEPGSALWQRHMHWRLAAAVAAKDVHILRQLQEESDSQAELLDETWDPVRLRIQTALIAGEGELARRLSEAHRDIDSYTNLYFQSLLMVGDYPAAHAIIDHLAHDAHRRPLLTAIQLALLEDRWQDCRPYLDQLDRRFPADGLPSRRRLYQICVMNIALREGRLTQARELLETLDPASDDAGLQVEWARLLLGEGREQEALTHCRKCYEGQGAGALAYGLTYAHEVPRHQLNHLWSQLLTPAAKGASISPPRSTTPRATTPLIGATSAMNAIRDLIAAWAPREETVLVCGETGAGKEVIARCLHATRHEHPFVAMNCAALPQSLAEAELFGHAAGAFTGAQGERAGAFRRAESGTLFLDEISSMPLELQGLLLRVLETGDFTPVGAEQSQRARCRVVAAANNDLAELVALGRFRADLWYRLDRLTLNVPPLRERKDDIPLLAQAFLDHLFGDTQPPRPSAKLVALWQAHDWPGNVRELRNDIERMCTLYGDATTLQAKHSRLNENTRSDRLPAIPAAPALSGRAARTADRRQRILALCQREGQATRKQLVDHLEASANTIRADLAELEAAGALRRIVPTGNLKSSYWVPVQR